MSRVDLILESDVAQSARVMQMSGMFDVPACDKTRVEFHFDVPIESRPWQVGLIVGPSGAGKSSVARHLFGEAMIDGYDWPARGAVVDGFGALGIRETTAALSSVGFSSPPNWLRPFSVLSNGERFRANMARALADTRELVVIDEFTSVVDRQVAQVGSHSIQKAVRAKPGKQFVAVTCHYDVEEWLQPDWVLEPHTGRFVWRELRRRPPIKIQIQRVHHSTWSLFARHHYMTAELNRSAVCFGAFVDGHIVAFDSWLPFVGRLRDSRQARRGHRTVCLPDWQGLGIGGRLFTTGAAMWSGLGYRVFSRTAHPAEIASRTRHGLWKQTSEKGFTARDGGRLAKTMGASRTTTRAAASFEYIGPPMSREQAERLRNS